MVCAVKYLSLAEDKYAWSFTSTPIRLHAVAVGHSDHFDFLILLRLLCNVSFVLNLSQRYDHFSYAKVQVKQSVQAWTGPEGLRRLSSQISGKSAHEGDKIFSPTHRPLFPLKKYCGTHFC